MKIQKVKQHTEHPFHPARHFTWFAYTEPAGRGNMNHAVVVETGIEV